MSSSSRVLHFLIAITICVISLRSSDAVLLQISRNPDDAKFYYYPNYDEGREIILNDVISLNKAQLKVGASTVLLIDGYRTNTSNSVMNRLLRKAYLTHAQNTNVITVDYGKLTGADIKFQIAIGSSLAYLSVLKNGVIGIMGNRVADFLNFLSSNGLLTYSSTHLIGHSLGSHISGAAGNFLKKKYSQTLGRITALDPATTPLVNQFVKKLKKGDASFVDIYHTNQAALGDYFPGTGHINCYVNGGDSQPKCQQWDKGFAPLPGICSHIYSWGFFAATFDKKVYACPCALGKSCSCKKNCEDDKCSNPILVGISASHSSRGNYHLLITDPDPEENYFMAKKYLN